jgi:hypothetical protein
VIASQERKFGADSDEVWQNIYTVTVSLGLRSGEMLCGFHDTSANEIKPR